MPRKTKIVNISLPEKTYKEMDRLAKKKDVSRSELLRDALSQYVASETRWEQIRKWGEESARKLGIKTEDDVDRLVHEVREEMQQEQSGQ